MSSPEKVSQYSAGEKDKLKEQLRLEVARELGIEDIQAGYFGDLTSFQCGKFGAVLNRRLQAVLKNEHMPKN